jgi:hypothetical protein
MIMTLKPLNTCSGEQNMPRWQSEVPRYQSDTIFAEGHDRRMLPFEIELAENGLSEDRVGNTEPRSDLIHVDPNCQTTFAERRSASAPFPTATLTLICWFPRPR